MADLRKRVAELQSQLERHRRSGLKEFPTRTIFIDPLLEALGWDVRDPDQVELEYPTIDAKSVDYALKINRKPVVLVEAKQLDDGLDDVKALTQVVGYAANDGVEWCVLTNGIRYRVYRSSEKAVAPDKLLFQVSIDPRDDPSLTSDEIISHLSRLSRDSLANGTLDALGEEIFTTAKVRKALDRLFLDPPASLIRLVKEALPGQVLTPSQVKGALARIWRGRTAGVSPAAKPAHSTSARASASLPRAERDYGEASHLDGKPAEIIELYRALDRFCQDLDPGQVARRHMAKYISWSHHGHIICCVHLLDTKLRVWLKLDPALLSLEAHAFARDVSKVGHWGVGDVELTIDSMQRLRDAHPLINRSFELV